MSQFTDCPPINISDDEPDHDHTIYELDGDMEIIGDENYTGISSDCPYCNDIDENGYTPT